MNKLPPPRAQPDVTLQRHSEDAPSVMPCTNEEIDYSPPRVGPTVPISSLQQHSNLPKNSRLQNIGQHQCNLCSQSPRLVSQHLFHSHYAANHICK